METIETKQIVVREVPVDLWRQVKIQAASEGKTLQSLVTEALQQYLKSA